MGVRHYRARFWAGAFIGDTPRGTGGFTLGQDDLGPYVGETDIRFVGVGIEIGGGATAGPLMVCLDGGGVLGVERSADIDKFYTNAFGQTIAFRREALEPQGLAAWLWHLDLSVDHSLTDRGSIGLGLFVERSLLSGDDVLEAIRDHSYAGAAVGTRLLLQDRILIEASYRHPLGTFDDADDQPDGWAAVRIGWVL